jgi:hypothetical protein
MRNRTRDLPACSAVSPPTTLPRAPVQWLDTSKLARLVLPERMYETFGNRAHDIYIDQSESLLCCPIMVASAALLTILVYPLCIGLG